MNQKILFCHSTRNIIYKTNFVFSLVGETKSQHIIKPVFVLCAIMCALFSHIPESDAKVTAQNCFGCMNNTKTQILTIFNFQTEETPFLAGNATFLIQPNPYAHTTNSTDFLDLTTWFNFIVTDNGRFDSDPMSGIIELVGVNNGTYSIMQIKGTPGFGMAPHPESSDDIFGTTGFSYVTQTFVNFGTPGTKKTIEAPLISDAALNNLISHGAKVNGIIVSSGNDLQPAFMISKAQRLSETPPVPIIFSISFAQNTTPDTLLNALGIPAYVAPKGSGISDDASFIPPVFAAPISGGGKFIIPPIIDEINPGLDIVLRFDLVEQNNHGSSIRAIELPMNAHGTNTGSVIKVDTSNPTGVPIPSGNVALFFSFETTGELNFSDPNSYSEKPTIHFGVEKSGTACPAGIVLYILQSGHWHSIEPGPTRNPSGDTIHTCAYNAQVDHFSSYLVGSNSTIGHEHGSDHDIHDSDHIAHSSHGGHGGHSHGSEDHGAHNAYHIITKDLNIFEIQYDLNLATAKILVGTTSKIDEIQVIIYSKEGGVRSAYLAKDQPFLGKIFQQSMKKYVFEVPLHPKETFFRVSVADKNYGLNQSVMIRGTAGTVVPWFANLHEAHENVMNHAGHTSHMETGFELKFSGAKKTFAYNGMDFTIIYEMAGAIVGMQVDEESKSVTFLTERVSGGNLILQIPRSLVDAIDDNFVIFATASPKSHLDYQVIGSTTEYYTLKMQIPHDASSITVVGARVVPEFGAIVMLVLASAVTTMLFGAKINWKHQKTL
jgi:predicted secreted protein with PEFG-CTERM motif